jgi:hypothetical protein
MPKISINVSDYMYWKLLGSGENVSYVVQSALNKYWKESRKEKKV